MKFHLIHALIFPISGNTKSSISDGLFDTTLYTDKQLRHFKYQLAGYVVSLVAGSVFVEQVLNNADTSHTNRLYFICVRFGLGLSADILQRSPKVISHYRLSLKTEENLIPL